MEGADAKRQFQLVAALAYLVPVIGGIAFLLIEPYNKDETVRFHARQSIGFWVAWFVVNVGFGILIAVIPASLRPLIAGLLELVNLAILVFWIFLIYKAYAGDRYRIPELADIVDNVAKSFGG
jgi:uncharacterized membrane protein